MSDVAITRRLAAILAADVAGYSAMMGADEAGTIAALRQIWSETFNPAVAARHGRIVKMMGDGALVEFGSVVDAVECAIAVQRAMGERNLAGEPAHRIPHRHQSRRHRHRGRRHFRRWRQRRGPPRRPSAAWRRSRLGRRPRPGQRQGRRHFLRCRGNRAQEHCAAGPCVAMGRRQDRACRRTRNRCGPFPGRRKAIHRRAAVLCHEQRSRAGILRRRPCRGHPDHAVEALRPVGDRPQFELRLQGPRGGRAPGRARARRALRAGGQRPQGRQPHPHHRAADRRRQQARTSGRTASTAASTTSLRCRTRSP